VADKPTKKEVVQMYFDASDTERMEMLRFRDEIDALDNKLFIPVDFDLIQKAKDNPEQVDKDKLRFAQIHREYNFLFHDLVTRLSAVRTNCMARFKDIKD